MRRMPRTDDMEPRTGLGVKAVADMTCTRIECTFTLQGHRGQKTLYSTWTTWAIVALKMMQGEIRMS